MNTSRGFEEVAQHIVQNAAILEVIELIQRIYASDEINLPPLAVRARERRLKALARLEARKPFNGHELRPGDLMREAGFAIGKLERHDAHADQVRAMDALEALGYDRANPEEHRAFRRPVA